MSKMQVTYEFHEAANFFPLDDENIDALAADIKAHGLRIPIEIFEDRIIDGRRRSLACKIAGVKPDYVEIETDDPAAYVASLNLHRRHLDASQVAMVGARMRDYYDRRAKERMREGGRKGGESKGGANLPQASERGPRARDEAAKAVGVSPRSIDFATTVLDKGSKQLQKAVDEGRVSVSKAAAIAKSVPKGDQMKVVTGEIVVSSPATECEIPDDAIVGSHYSCPTCGQKWPEGRSVYGKNT